ncbi:Undecaprenyl-phosphate alpha-N-acetylglucosaminyl 1-phosphate transferase [Usitatibacter rugosus]|uniref:Undecaprenyl-phosphate alpha-N-acetylglucosaminyl 1-phosphate transferase n=1 Tax=Usitatibacter rugosus TaxID=2732067 RepID=A0A6M4GWS0_9PROT|nr:Undecaprenyl-phosphate alpha-N-acetylglucosaminyl 1-phosphate transferase [Usitatibacter rugosus]
MVEASQQPWLSIIAAVIISAVGTLLFSQLAPSLGLVDHPGGRKAHLRAVPLVGGLAIFIALIGTAWFTGIARPAAPFLVAITLVAAVGVWDDFAEVSPRVKLAIQIAAACLMIWGAGVELRSVGDLLGWRSIGLSAFAIPMTVFAVVGVINAVNMMDGMDGLGGSIAVIALAWYAAVAVTSGLTLQWETALILAGAIAGFLLFNLRFPWQPHARVFLGDAGSLMIGFALGWFAIDLTQGPGRTFPPIAALWVIVLPLADCVSLMTRRLRARRSPFEADRQHIHHYLLSRGFTHSQTLGILVLLSSAFGAVGYFGWRMGVPEPVLFWPFFFGYFAYHFWITREWKRLEAAT